MLGRDDQCEVERGDDREHGEECHVRPALARVQQRRYAEDAQADHDDEEEQRAGNRVGGVGVPTSPRLRDVAQVRDGLQVERGVSGLGFVG
jgi:hypothetical protein